MEFSHSHGVLVSLALGRGPLTLSQGDRSEGWCVCKKEMSHEEAGSERVEAQAFSFPSSVLQELSQSL